MNRAAVFSVLIFTAVVSSFTRADQSPSSPVPATTTDASKALVWDAESKDYAAKPGETLAPFIFNLTNVSSSEVIITSVSTSCGCTVAQLPAQPWHIAPGTNGQIKVTVNLAGKSGHVTKQVNVTSSVGNKALLVNVDIPPVAPPLAENLRGDRNANMEKAKADRQIVFQGDCRSCHVDKGVDKLGKELYAADCGICHDSNHRASSVPDLRAPKTPRDNLYWSSWISHGRPGSLMPAFAKSEGGPLSQEQIDSLVDYLSKNFPQGPATPAIPAVKVPAAVGGAGQ